MPASEAQDHVRWALGMLNDEWYSEIVTRRANVLKESHNRLRTLVKGKKLAVKAHTPPDILGCYVLVPGGKS